MTNNVVNGKLVGIITIIVIAIVVSVTLFSQGNVPSSSPVQQSVIPVACNALENGVLPDPKCTPGAIDPSVTQENIDSTICVPGYTKTVRPPVSVTEPQKLESMKSYGFVDSPSNYEFDHLIPLELGGAPDDMNNLWPEPHSNSFTKDSLENYLHDQVCSGNMKLKTAQDEIASNWLKYWMMVKN